MATFGKGPPTREATGSQSSAAAAADLESRQAEMRRREAALAAKELRLEKEAEMRRREADLAAQELRIEQREAAIRAQAHAITKSNTRAATAAEDDTSGRRRRQVRDDKVAEIRVSSDSRRKQYAGFLSHFKLECGTEARYLYEKLKELLPQGRNDLFLDSDDLNDLRLLLQHVKDTEVLVLLQSKGVLSVRCWPQHLNTCTRLARRHLREALSTLVLFILSSYKSVSLS